MTGCNYSAKNTVDMTYLATAEARGALIFTGVEVRSLEKFADGYRLYLVVRAEDGSEQPRTLEAQKVVLSAGSLGSYAILARSRRDRKLAVSAALGSRFSGNGDILGFAYNTDRRTQIGEGPTITRAAKFWQSGTVSDRFLIEEGAIPKALDALVRTLVPILRHSGIDTDHGWVDALQEWLRIQADRFGLESNGALNHSMVYLGMGFENSLGTLVLDPDTDRVRVDWPDVAEQPFARIIDDTMLKMTRQLGGTYVKNPRAREFLGDSLITVHPLGGCPMGDDAASGVVNVRGEVFGHEGGLYVADGAILPGPVGVNPALTIAALSEWIADGIAQSWQAGG